MSDLNALQSGLNYRFSDSALLRMALTHRSYGAENNERFEFLGDGLLNFVVADALFAAHPAAAEGMLSRLRARVVQKQTLAQQARRLRLGDYLFLGSGELKSGGQDRDSILADCLEAIIGAVYLDGGFAAGRHFVLEQFNDTLSKLSPDSLLKDPKSRLQEFLQKSANAPPQYRLVRTSGEPHQQHFVVQCVIDGTTSTFHGEGSSKRNAEQRAADAAYQHLTGDG
ncbi:MAG: ribonuclease III [Gammaproteobacteria bacterium]|nr:ribonuclease III [Gammaproteobacteria bacterium]MDH3466781.1 ribonuclease III [Gammaproteobacteria bacterium]